MDTKGFILFENIINVLVSSFRSVEYLCFSVHRFHCKCCNPTSPGFVGFVDTVVFVTGDKVGFSQVGGTFNQHGIHQSLGGGCGTHSISGTMVRLSTRTSSNK